MAPTPSTNIRHAIALAAIGCALGLAACGSSSKPPAATSNDHALGVKFASCMRDHGVPSFPDPEAGAGVQIPVSLGTNPSPAFKSAMQACDQLIPANTAPPVASASQKAAAVKLAQCMREHGVPNYPDPTYQDGHEIPPSIADPSINPASPAFGAASKTWSIAVIRDRVTPPVLRPASFATAHVSWLWNPHSARRQVHGF